MKWFGTPQFVKNDESVETESILMELEPYVLINRKLQHPPPPGKPWVFDTFVMC